MFILIGMFLGFKLFECIKNKKLIFFRLKILKIVFSAFIALGLNASSLFSTFEYSKYSTRGKSDLTIDESGDYWKLMWPFV